MTAAFQTIFDKQPDLKNTTQDIIDYLNSDGDTKPLAELNKRKITPDKAQNYDTVAVLWNGKFHLIITTQKVEKI